MISMHWVMTVPPHLDPARFDAWYLDVHTLYGKASKDIIRYVVNRRLTQQPACACGDTYRVAQEYWADWDAFVGCWNSPSGHAVLGDGLANLGLGVDAIPAVAITHDVQYDVAKPANFSMFRRGYRNGRDGTIVKFLAYGTGGLDLQAWYRDRYASLGQDDRLREHIFGTTLSRRLEVGCAAVIPGPGQVALDWVQELWFDDTATALAFLADAPFMSVWTALSAQSGDIRAALYRGQEMLVANTAIAHDDAD